MAGDQLLVVEDATPAREVAQRRERLDREAKSRRTTALASRSRISWRSRRSATCARSHPDQGRSGRTGGSTRRRAQSACRRARSRSRSSTAASARSRRATSCSRARRARSSSASTCGRTTTRARRPSARTSTSSCTASSTRRSPTSARRIEGMLRPEEREVILGEAEVREMFKVSKIGIIAGCSVRSGVINRARSRARHPRWRSRSSTARSRRCAASRTTSARSAKDSSAVSASRTSTTSRSATSSSATARNRSRGHSTARGVRPCLSGRCRWPSDHRRSDRVAEAIREEIATFLAERGQGSAHPRPRHRDRREVTRDLRHAKVFVSVLGSESERAATFEGLDSVATHLRARVGRALRLRARARDRVSRRRERRARRAHRAAARAGQTRNCTTSGGCDARGRLTVD